MPMTVMPCGSISLHSSEVGMVAGIMLCVCALMTLILFIVRSLDLIKDGCRAAVWILLVPVCAVCAVAGAVGMALCGVFW